MTDYPILSKPPIREALIDFQFNIGETFDENKFNPVIKAAQKTFPKEFKKYQLEGKVEVQKGKVNNTTAENKLMGVILKNDSEDSVIQYRANGYTFNNIKKYSNWNIFKTNAIKYWELLDNAIDDIVPNRISLRYVNSLPLAPGVNLDDYINGCPILPLKEASFIGMFSKLSFEFEDVFGNYILAIENPMNKTINLIVDIEFYINNTSKLSLAELEKILDNLRNYKNKVFFSVITEKKLEEFK